MFTTFLSGQLFLEAWYLDLGCIEHMIIEEEHGFIFSNQFPNPFMTYLGDDNTQEAIGSGINY